MAVFHILSLSAPIPILPHLHLVLPLFFPLVQFIMTLTTPSTLDLPPSAAELNRLQSSFDSPEFQDLFLSYLRDIQSPQSKKTHEEELVQLERQRTGHANVQILTPQPGFTIRTTGTERIFVNIAFVEHETETWIEDAVPKEAKGGFVWQIPHAFSKPRKEKIANGK